MKGWVRISPKADTAPLTATEVQMRMEAAGVQAEVIRYRLEKSILDPMIITIGGMLWAADGDPVAMATQEGYQGA